MCLKLLCCHFCCLKMRRWCCLRSTVDTSVSISLQRASLTWNWWFRLRNFMRLTHTINLFHFLQLDLRPRPINYQKEKLPDTLSFFCKAGYQYNLKHFSSISLFCIITVHTLQLSLRHVGFRTATDHTAGRKRSPWLKSQSNQLISTPRSRSPGASSWEYLFGLLTRLQQIRRVQTLRFISATTARQHSEQNRKDILGRVRTRWMCLQWNNTTFHRSLSKMTSCNKGCLG